MHTGLDEFKNILKNLNKNDYVNIVIDNQPGKFIVNITESSTKIEIPFVDEKTSFMSIIAIIEELYPKFKLETKEKGVFGISKVIYPLIIHLSDSIRIHVSNNLSKLDSTFAKIKVLYAYKFIDTSSKREEKSAFKKQNHKSGSADDSLKKFYDDLMKMLKESENYRNPFNEPYEPNLKKDDENEIINAINSIINNDKETVILKVPNKCAFYYGTVGDLMETCELRTVKEKDFWNFFYSVVYSKFRESLKMHVSVIDGYKNTRPEGTIHIGSNVTAYIHNKDGLYDEWLLEQKKLWQPSKVIEGEYKLAYKNDEI